MTSSKSVGQVFLQSPENVDVDVGEKTAKEGFIHATMPHGVGIAANLLEWLAELRKSSQDARTMRVTNPDPKKRLNPAANFKPR